MITPAGQESWDDLRESGEQKLEISRKATKIVKTPDVSNGLNATPTVMAAPIGMAIRKERDVTTNAAIVAIPDNFLTEVDGFPQLPLWMPARTAIPPRVIHDP